MRFNRAMDADVVEAAAGAVIAEIGWRDDAGAVHLAARLPLADERVPALALTYDDLGLAQHLAAAPEIVMVISDARYALRGWQPLAVEVAASLTHDPHGDRFVDRFVEQELRKFPPSRLRADSLLQRRENWWYLARVLVSLRPVGPVRSLEARTDAEEGVLCWRADGALRVTTVSIDDWTARRIRLSPIGGGALPVDRSGRAALLRHDATLDQERRATLVATGLLEEAALAVEARHGDPALPPVPGVWQRIRAARAFERACRRGIAEAGF